MFRLGVELIDSLGNVCGLCYFLGDILLHLDEVEVLHGQDAECYTSGTGSLVFLELAKALIDFEKLVLSEKDLGGQLLLDLLVEVHLVLYLEVLLSLGVVLLIESSDGLVLS